VAKSFLKSIEPSRQRWKMVDWPFPVEGEKPRVKMRVLGQAECEAAYLATVDHFKKQKKSIDVRDPAFALRERAEIVFRAFSADDKPIADDVDELLAEPSSLIEELNNTYSQFYGDGAATPYTSKDMDALVELLKKNTPVALLSALPSSWLIGLITTLASPPVTSTQASEGG
jgi:hypothetical protein